MAWGTPLTDFPRVFAPRAEPESATDRATPAGAPYDIILGADLLYNPTLYPLLLPTVLQLLAINVSVAPEHRPDSECEFSPSRKQAPDGQLHEQPQFGVQSAVVFMCYMERGGEDAFFAAAEDQGVLCDHPTLLAPLAALGEELGCVMVRMRNAKAVANPEVICDEECIQA
jgi:hypothetical protein